MAYPIILPAFTEARWQYCNQVDAADSWDEFAHDLLDEARSECNPSIKDDLAMLCMQATERANMADPAMAYSMDLFNGVAA